MKFNHRFVQLLIATNPHTEGGREKLALWRKQHLLQTSTQPSFLELKHFSKSGVITLCLPRSSSSKRPWDINTTYICGYIPQLYKQGRCFFRPGGSRNQDNHICHMNHVKLNRPSRFWKKSSILSLLDDESAALVFEGQL